MTALELLYDIASRVEAERLKYRNDTITLEAMQQNVLTISEGIDTSISELSIEELRDVDKEENHWKVIEHPNFTDENTTLEELNRMERMELINIGEIR